MVGLPVGKGTKHGLKEVTKESPPPSVSFYLTYTMEPNVEAVGKLAVLLAPRILASKKDNFRVLERRYWMEIQIFGPT